MATGVQQQFLHDGKYYRPQLRREFIDRNVVIKLNRRTTACLTLGNQALNGSHDIRPIWLHRPILLLTNAMTVVAFNKVFSSSHV